MPSERPTGKRSEGISRHVQLHLGHRVQHQRRKGVQRDFFLYRRCLSPFRRHAPLPRQQQLFQRHHHDVARRQDLSRPFLLPVGCPRYVARRQDVRRHLILPVRHPVHLSRQQGLSQERHLPEQYPPHYLIPDSPPPTLLVGKMMAFFQRF